MYSLANFPCGQYVDRKWVSESRETRVHGSGVTYWRELGQGYVKMIFFKQKNTEDMSNLASCL